MGEKRGYPAVSLGQFNDSPAARHVACLECLSLHSEHESYCVRLEKKDVYGAITVHTLTHRPMAFVFVAARCSL